MTDTRLTHLEETAALIKAGIDPDCSTWTDDTLESAGVVLDAAQASKAQRLQFGRNPQTGY